MNKLFGKNSLLYEFRWLLVFLVLAGSLLTFHELTGRRILTFSNQEKWSSSGPGYHK